MSIKTKLFIYIIVLLSFNSYAQTIKLQELEDMQDINTDSLEKHLQPQQPPKYLKQLLILEYCFWLNEKPEFGSKLEEIDLLANTLKRQDVLPIYNFCQGMLSIKKRQHKEAFVFLSNAAQGFENQKDTLGIIRTYVNLAQLNLSQTREEERNVKAGIEYAKKAVKVADAFGNKFLQIYALATLNIGYNSSGDKKDLEKITAQKQLKLVKSDTTLQKYALSAETTLAILASEKGDYAEAYRLTKPSVGAAKKELQKFYYNGFLINLIVYCIKLKKFDEAKQYLEEVMANTKDKELWLIREQAFLNYKEIYQAQKNYQKALVYADSSAALQYKIHETENIAKLNELEISYKTKEVQIKNTSLEKENELVKSRNKIIFIALLATGLLTLLLLSVLYFLNKSRKKAEIQAEEIGKLSHIRDQYIKIVAHDLRSPLYAMQGMYEMIKNAISTKRFDDLEKISNYIDETGIKTKNLLDNLLNWGMSQQEEVPYEPKSLSLLEVINDTLNIYEAIKLIRLITVSVDCSSAIRVYADYNGLQLILRNLIDNAIKSLPTTNGRIDISVSVNSNNSIIISIHDNGKGIAEEKLQLINAIFVKPLSAPLGKNGLGLGIALIGKFVKRNRGVIIAHSIRNQGTEFMLTLPQN